MKEINDISQMPTIIDKDGRIYTLRLYVTAWDRLAVGYSDILNHVNICSFIVDATKSKEYYIKQAERDNVEIECYIEGVDTLEEAFNKCYAFITHKNGITFEY